MTRSRLAVAGAAVRFEAVAPALRATLEGRRVKVDGPTTSDGRGTTLASPGGAR
jgi:hypothetical protein